MRSLVARKFEGSRDKAYEFTVIDNFGFVSPVGVVMEAVGIAQNVVEFLSACGIENGVGCAGALLTKIDELAKHVAGYEMVRIGHADKAFENIAHGFSDLAIVRHAAIQVASQQRVALVMLGY